MFDYHQAIADLEDIRSAIDDAINALRRLNITVPQPVKTEASSSRKVSPRSGGSDTNGGHLTPALHVGDGRPSPVQDAPLEMLKKAKASMTSIEAFEALEKTGSNTPAGSVYGALKSLYERGLVEKVRNDEGRNAWRAK